MSERKAISAEQFKNKATRLVDIDGFEPNEKITVKVKPVSLLAMMTNGKLPNELKAVIASLFNENKKGAKQANVDDIEELSIMQELMNKVCEECLVEPAYDEVKEYLTDIQKTQIFTQAQGNIKDYTPSDAK